MLFCVSACLLTAWGPIEGQAELSYKNRYETACKPYFICNIDPHRWADMRSLIQEICVSGLSCPNISARPVLNLRASNFLANCNINVFGQSGLAIPKGIGPGRETSSAVNFYANLSSGHIFFSFFGLMATVKHRAQRRNVDALLSEAPCEAY